MWHRWVVPGGTLYTAAPLGMNIPVETATVDPEVPKSTHASVFTPISTISPAAGRAVATEEPPTAALTNVLGASTWTGALSWSLGKFTVAVLFPTDGSPFALVRAVIIHVKNQSYPLWLRVGTLDQVRRSVYVSQCRLACL